MSFLWTSKFQASLGPTGPGIVFNDKLYVILQAVNSNNPVPGLSKINLAGDNLVELCRVPATRPIPTPQYYAEQSGIVDAIIYNDELYVSTSQSYYYPPSQYFPSDYQGTNVYKLNETEDGFTPVITNYHTNRHKYFVIFDGNLYIYESAAVIGPPGARLFRFDGINNLTPLVEFPYTGFGFTYQDAYSFSNNGAIGFEGELYLGAPGVGFDAANYYLLKWDGGSGYVTVAQILGQYLLYAELFVFNNRLYVIDGNRVYRLNPAKNGLDLLATGLGGTGPCSIVEYLSKLVITDIRYKLNTGKLSNSENSIDLLNSYPFPGQPAVTGMGTCFNSEEFYGVSNHGQVLTLYGFINIDSSSLVPKRTYDLTGSEFGITGLTAKFVDFDSVEHVCTITPGYTNTFAQITVPDEAVLGIGTLTLTDANDFSDSIEIEIVKWIDIISEMLIVGRTFDLAGVYFGTFGLTALFLDSESDEHECFVEAGYTGEYAQVTIPSSAALGAGTLTLTNSDDESDSILLNIVATAAEPVYNTITKNFGSYTLDFHEEAITPIKCLENTNPLFVDTTISDDNFSEADLEKSYLPKIASPAVDGGDNTFVE